jgi:hypothetical protein
LTSSHISTVVLRLGLSVEQLVIMVLAGRCCMACSKCRVCQVCIHVCLPNTFRDNLTAEENLATERADQVCPCTVASAASVYMAVLCPRKTKLPTH